MSLPDEARLARLAEYARAHPGRYRARVAGLAVLGYAYLLGVIVLLLAATPALVYGLIQLRAGALMFKLALPLLWLVGMGLKALWIRLEPPKGIILRPQDAPALMAEIESVRRATGAGRVHQVLLTDELNASVTQLPRLGVFGWYRNYLVLGLPLLASLSPAEFRGVLAHEFGHISGSHSRFGTWLYRVRSTWDRVAAELRESRHRAQWIFNVFFRWYAPYFDSYYAVLSRQQEFEADQAAARAAGANAIGAALCRTAVVGGYLGRSFWPGVFTGIREQAAPPAGVYQRLWTESRAAAADPRAPEWLRGDLGQPTAPWDSHPSLSERLAALGVEAPTPEPLTVTAADALLGASASRWVEQFSRAWASSVDQPWRDEHHAFLRAVERLREIEAGAEDADPRLRLERLHLLLQVRGADEAIPAMRAFVESGAEDAEIRFLLGQELASCGDAEGLPHLSRAMELDDNYILAACDVAAAYLASAGRGEEAAAYRDRYAEWARVLDVAHEERSIASLRIGDTLLPHGLSAQQLDSLRGALALVGGMKRVILVRKQVTALPETPLWIVFIQRPRQFWPGGEKRSAEELVQRVLAIVEPLGGSSIVATADGEYRWLFRKAAKVHGAEIYPALGSRAAAPAAGNPAAPAGVGVVSR